MKARTRKRSQRVHAAPADGPSRPVFPLLSVGALSGVAGLVALTVWAFSHVLFASDPPVLSASGLDLATQFIHWRRFGFEELARGNLPLWNPHVFCGIPFFGGFQSALLYPPNWLHLVLPLPWAINLSIVLHILATGLATGFWAWRRGLSPWPCFFAASAIMFSGPVFLHVYPGHLSNLNSMPWVPLILACIEGTVEAGGAARGWWLAGTGAVAMLVLAGHPQYVFHAAVAAGLYALLLLWRSPAPLSAAVRLAAMAAAAMGLTAVQLFTGLAESIHTVRAGGLSYEYAAMFSLPPEGLLTALAPDLFGSPAGHSCWRREYTWEMSIFFSVTALVMAGFGARSAPPGRRRFAVVLAASLLVLALGSNTPLFQVLFQAVPGFGMFRGHSKFAFPMILFVGMLAGLGLQLVSEGKRPGPRALRAMLAGAALLSVMAVAVGTASFDPPADGWRSALLKRVYARVASDGETVQSPELSEDPRFLTRSALTSSSALALAAASLAVVASILSWVSPAGRATALLTLTAVVELGIFVRPLAPVFRQEETIFPEVASRLLDDPGDYRLLFMDHGNSAMTTGGRDVWGHDPGTPRRIAELMAVTQGSHPDGASQYQEFTRGHPLYRLLRLKYVLRPPAGELLFRSPVDPLPRVFLTHGMKIASGRDGVLKAMLEPDFDPLEVAVLEAPPRLRPSSPPQPGGTVRIVEESTDHVTLEADLPGPAILVMTDAYHPYWSVESLDRGSQELYEIVPVDHVLLGIPLDAGRHRLRLEYRPAGFSAGLALSLLTLVAYLAAIGCWARRGRTG